MTLQELSAALDALDRIEHRKTPTPQAAVVPATEAEVLPMNETPEKKIARMGDKKTTP
jgi:hypothetical protein